MNSKHLSVFCLSVLLAMALPAALAAGPPATHLPPCEPGYQWVEETCFKEVEREVCKLVPEMKKVRKIVYATKENPFCLRRSGLKALHRGHDACGEGDCAGACLKCKGPYCRT